MLYVTENFDFSMLNGRDIILDIIHIDKEACKKHIQFNRGNTTTRAPSMDFNSDEILVKLKDGGILISKFDNCNHLY